MTALVPRFEEGRVRFYAGDCVEVMAALEASSVDAIVTDPPYGLEFMGKEWDKLDPNRGRWAGKERTSFAPEDRGGGSGNPWEGNPVLGQKRNQRCRTCGRYRFSGTPCQCDTPDFVYRGYGPEQQAWHLAWCQAAYRVLKPGGHLVAFGGTRTFHRLTCALEDAGFEIRDCLMWLYGSGFPKSHDVAKAIDRAHGAEVSADGYVPNLKNQTHGKGWGGGHKAATPEALTEAAQAWLGWGTALKPAWEPVVLARRPLIGTLVQNVQRLGTGGLNVDGCRIPVGDEVLPVPQSDPGRRDLDAVIVVQPARSVEVMHEVQRASIERAQTMGRWPANLMLDEDSAPMLDAQSGQTASPAKVMQGRRSTSTVPFGSDAPRVVDCYADSGGASRFFYTAKASRADRDGSKHPTVKPTDLCKWLVRLVTPPGGTVLDPFCGSGPVIYAARDLGFGAIGIDQESRYLDEAVRRLRQGVLA